MSIYYAGYPLLQSSPELERWADSYHQYKDSSEFSPAGWSGAAICGTQVPPPPIPDNKIRMNKLYWPNGVSRWATFHGLVDSTTLALIRTACVSSPYQTLTLRDNDSATPVECSMRMLAPRPISQIGNLPATETQLYLITLVDKRFYFWNETSSLTTITSWASWFSGIASALGISITVPTIATAYKTPSYKLLSYSSPLPLILEGVARLVGRRIQCNLDGTFTLIKWDTAYAAMTAAMTTHAALKIAGGVFDEEDIGRMVPATFTGLFKSTSDTYYTKDVTLASLAISEYGGTTGVSGARYNYYSDYIYVHNTGTYNPICNALTTQAANDWYGWQLAVPDVTYAGIINWTALAMADYIEWEHTLACIKTHVVREPFWTQPNSDPDCNAETQIIRIPTGASRNADGDYLGYIQEYDYVNNTWQDSRQVWVRNAN